MILQRVGNVHDGYRKPYKLVNAVHWPTVRAVFRISETETETIKQTFKNVPNPIETWSGLTFTLILRSSTCIKNICRNPANSKCHADVMYCIIYRAFIII